MDKRQTMTNDPIKLLYVDDEEDLARVVVRSLRLDKAMEVRAVHSGHAALAIIADGDWRPDVVLLDVMMPDLDGPGTFDRIAELSGNTLPVIFFTARAQNHELVRLAARGAIGILIKPFDPLSLAGDIRRLFAGWRERAIVPPSGGRPMLHGSAEPTTSAGPVKT